MKNKQINLNGCNLTKTLLNEQRLRDSLRLLDGISRLPLESDTELAQKVKVIYGQSEKNGKE